MTRTVRARAVETREDFIDVVQDVVLRCIGLLGKVEVSLNNTMAHGRPVALVRLTEPELPFSPMYFTRMDRMVKSASFGKVALSGWWNATGDPFVLTFTFIIIDDELNERLTVRGDDNE